MECRPGGGLDQLALPGAVITSFDFYSFAKDPELLAAFANTTDACLTASSICSNPASNFYWDTFHPSSTSHALLAGALHRAMVATFFQQLLADVMGVGPGKSLADKVVYAQASSWLVYGRPAQGRPGRGTENRRSARGSWQQACWTMPVTSRRQLGAATNSRIVARDDCSHDPGPSRGLFIRGRSDSGR